MTNQTQQELTNELEILKRLQKRLDHLILSTPTGEERNKLTEENILMLIICSKKEEYLKEFHIN